MTTETREIAFANLTASTFNHCATVCPHRHGNLVAWYAGSGECRDDQSVYLLFITKDWEAEPLRLGDCTGNPVLWALDSETAVLLYAKFADITVERLVDRWKYCDLWIQKVKFSDRIRLLGEPIQLAFAREHLLGRCSPVRFRTKFYLPLYNEMERHGVVFEGDGVNFHCYTEPGYSNEVVVRLGRDMIQPALWATAGRIHSLSRNFHSPLRTAQYSYSTEGRYWSQPTNTTICNHNSSLATLLWGNKVMLMWNDTKHMIRRRMMLGEFPYLDNAIMLAEDYGAYPSLCENNDGSLAMVFTTRRGISFGTCTKQQYRQLRRGSAVRTNSGGSPRTGKDAGILRERV